MNARRARFYWGLGAVFPLALLAGAESALRRAYGPPPAEPKVWQDEVRYLNREIDLPFFIKEGAGERALWRTNRPMAIPQSFPDRLGERELRVFVLGESVASRLGTGALLEPLASAFPERRPRVINAGMGAYDAHRTGMLLGELSARSPGLFVVLVGNNQSFAPRRYIGLKRIWYPGYRLNLALRRLWLWSLAQDRLNALLPAPAPVADLASFERDLRGILRGARERSAPAVVCTLASNARDWPPHGELPLNDRDFFLGWSALEEGRLAEAGRRLTDFARREPADPMGRFFLGRLLARQGRWDRARGELLAAQAHDYPDRCTPEKNELIRRVAREEGASVADVARAFEAAAPHGLPGSEIFIDNVHWAHRLDGPVARLIAAAASGRPDLGAAAAVRAALGGYAGREEDLAAKAAEQAVQAGLCEPPTLSERAVAAFELALQKDPAAVSAMLKDPGLFAKAVADNEWLRSMGEAASRSWPGVLLHVGEASARLGRRSEAVELLRRAAQAPGPSAPLARRLLSRQLALAGERAAALRELAVIPKDSRERVLADKYLAYYGAKDSPLK